MLTFPLVSSGNPEFNQLGADGITIYPTTGFYSSTSGSGGAYDYNSGTLVGPFSYFWSFWARPTTTNSDAAVMVTNPAYSATDSGFQIFLNKSRLRVLHTSIESIGGANTYRDHLDVTYNGNLGGWNHYMIFYDELGNTAVVNDPTYGAGTTVQYPDYKVYINGVLQTADTDSSEYYRYPSGFSRSYGMHGEITTVGSGVHHTQIGRPNFTYFQHSKWSGYVAEFYASPRQTEGDSAGVGLNNTTQQMVDDWYSYIWDSAGNYQTLGSNGEASGLQQPMFYLYNSNIDANAALSPTVHFDFLEDSAGALYGNIPTTPYTSN